MTYEHTALMEDYLSKCKEMLIIGWKGQEEFFLEKLKELCGESKIQATFVTCQDNKTFEEIEKVIPNITPSFFTDNHIEFSYDKGERNINFEHAKGSFSAYILKIAKGDFESFFNFP